MRLSLSTILAVAAGVAHAASSWSFDEGSLIVAAKGSSSSTLEEKLNVKSPLSTAVVLGASDVAKITLTAKDNGKAKKPHQAFLLLQDTATGLEAPFPLAIKDNGKGSVQIAQKDIPVQLLAAAQPVRASLVIASFGSALGFSSAVFDLDLQRGSDAAPLPTGDDATPLRYGKRPEIHHVFRPDARSPPKIISLFFVLAVVATLPVLFGAWLFLGANVNHLGKAIAGAPVSHAAFFGSILAMEGVFFLYYTQWNLIQMLPAAGVVGTVAVLSGTKALGEVQARRLAGER